MSKDNKNVSTTEETKQVSDVNMPRQQTMNYSQDLKLRTTDYFVQLFTTAVNAMPYSMVIDVNGKKIKLNDFVKDVESHNRVFTIHELNEAIAVIAACPFGYVRELMSLVENKQRQSQLWTADVPQPQVLR